MKANTKATLPILISIKIFIAILFTAIVSSCINPYAYRPQPQPYPAYYPPQQSYQQQSPIYQPQPVAYQYAQPTAPTTNYSSLDLGFKKVVTHQYNFMGKHYVPMSPQQALRFRQRGIACYFKPEENPTNSIQESAPPNMITASHNTLPLPCVIKITSMKNGRVIYARVNDRGPFNDPNRIIDISKNGAEQLGFIKQGLLDVTIEVMSVGDGALKITR